MGLRGPIAKPPEERARRRTRTEVERQQRAAPLVVRETTTIPKCPKGLLAKHRKLWED